MSTVKAGENGKPMAYSVAVREMKMTRPEAIRDWKHKKNQREALAEFHARRAAPKAAKEGKK